MKIIESHSESDTIQAGFAFAENLGPGDVVCLHGDLGAGKTHFIKGIAMAFGVSKDTVNSPTFALIHEYAGSLPLYHFDAYRLNSEQEARNIGAEDYFYADGVSLVEWPEKMGTLIPENAIHITIKKINEGFRRIEIA
jgi:tRNA threonylcarbamoyladenosine biosynthesis protein TsaE